MSLTFVGQFAMKRIPLSMWDQTHLGKRIFFLFLTVRQYRHDDGVDSFPSFCHWSHSHPSVLLRLGFYAFDHCRDFERLRDGETRNKDALPSSCTKLLSGPEPSIYTRPLLYRGVRGVIKIWFTINLSYCWLYWFSLQPWLHILMVFGQISVYRDEFQMTTSQCDLWVNYT